VRVKTRCKRTVKTQVKREGVEITTQGKMQRNSLQINVGQRNDPTIIIHAQESRAFESKSLTPVLGRHIFAGFEPTYYRRADIFPGRHISGTT
jgi:hypothetical protein